mgnify:CR=1 FL=1
MQLVDSHIAGVLAGHDRIREAEALLPIRWRERLLRAYAAQRQTYERALAGYRQRSKTHRRTLLLILAGAALLGLVGWASASLGGPPGVGEAARALGWIGALAFVGVGLFWLGQEFWGRPRRPAHPPAVRVEPLLPRWQAGLRGELPSAPGYAGAVGEFAMVRALLRLHAPGYILYKLQQERGDDLDIVLVWPAGIWLFEVKYWAGLIAWRDGVWEHRSEGGAPADIGEPPDRQWRRMADDVLETLRRHAPDLLEQHPALARVRGGLVFTHPRARYAIAARPPFDWGTPAAWIRHLEQIAPLPGVTTRDLLWIVDALLTRHHQICGEKSSRSMELYATHVIRDAEAALATATRRWRPAH